MVNQINADSGIRRRSQTLRDLVLVNNAPESEKVVAVAVPLMVAPVAVSDDLRRG
jgi:hypothetical protein